MKKRVWICLSGLLVMMLVIACHQKKELLKVSAATAQHWSGGIAGRSGTHYTFVLQKEGKANISFDSIWVEGEGTFVIKTGYSPDDNTAFIANKNDTTGTYTLQLNTFHVMGNNYPTDMPRPVERSTVNPFKLNGKAVIAFTCKGKQQLLAVSSFKQGPAVNYP